MPRRPATAPPPAPSVATGTWRTAIGVHLTVLVAVADTPERSSLHRWWPLYRAARWAALVQEPAVIHLDEFELVGTFARSTLPDVWIYRHRRSARELFVDHHGCTYELRPLRTDPRRGRFHECGPRLAVARAGLSTWSPPGRLPLLEVVSSSITDDVFPVPVPVSPDDACWVPGEQVRATAAARRTRRTGRPALAAVRDLPPGSDRPEGFDHYADALQAAQRLYDAEPETDTQVAADAAAAPEREPGPGLEPEPVTEHEHDDVGCGDPSCPPCHGPGEPPSLFPRWKPSTRGASAWRPRRG